MFALSQVNSIVGYSSVTAQEGSLLKQKGSYYIFVIGNSENDQSENMATKIQKNFLWQIM